MGRQCRSITALRGDSRLLELGRVCELPCNSAVRMPPSAMTREAVFACVPPRLRDIFHQTRNIVKISGLIGRV